MSNNKIEAHKITKPIQLLASWLVGLSITNITFLTAAANISHPWWVPGMLTIAAVINVPIFVISIFVLQTKFRPEMQEDSFYADYLNNKNENRVISESVKKTNNSNDSLEELAGKITKLIESKPEKLDEKIKKIMVDDKIVHLASMYSDSRTLSELYVRPDFWDEMISEWGDSLAFKSDLKKLISEGLVTMTSEDIKTAELSQLGIHLAEYCEDNKMLFSQKKADFFYGSGKSSKGSCMD